MSRLIILIALLSFTGVSYASRITTADFFTSHEKNNHYLSAISAPIKFPIYFSIKADHTFTENSDNDALYALLKSISFFKGYDASTGRCSDIDQTERSIFVGGEWYRSILQFGDNISGQLAHHLYLRSSNITKYANELGITLGLGNYSCVEFNLSYRNGTVPPIKEAVGHRVLNTYDGHGYNLPFVLHHIDATDNIFNSAQETGEYEILRPQGDIQVSLNGHIVDFLKTLKSGDKITFTNTGYGALSNFQVRGLNDKTWQLSGECVRSPKSNFAPGDTCIVTFTEKKVNGAQLNINGAIRIHGYQMIGGAIDRIYSFDTRHSGALIAWGNNDHGQLGNGTTESSINPVQAYGLTSGVMNIIQGKSHTVYALMQNGTVKYWGLGPSNSNVTKPTLLSNVNAKVIDMAVNSNDEVFLLTNEGQVLIGSKGYISPLPYVSIPNAVVIKATQNSACVLTRIGGVKCFDQNNINTDGELGNGVFGGVKSRTVVQVSGLTEHAQQLIVTSDHGYCTLLNTGNIKCWGANYFGQLGNGGSDNSIVPVYVQGITNAISLFSDPQAGSACALLSIGQVTCWGGAPLGNSQYNNSPRPIAVKNLDNVISLFHFLRYGVASYINNSPNLKNWGNNITKPTNYLPPFNAFSTKSTLISLYSAQGSYFVIKS